MRRLFRWLHLWLSVPFGIIISLVCFSGAMLVFEDEVTELMHPSVYRVDVPPGGKPLPLSRLVDAAMPFVPSGSHVTGITLPARPDRACRVGLSKPKRAAIYVNPYTGQVTGSYERPAFFKTMFSLHRWLLDSRPSGDGIFWGKLLVGVSTLMFVLALLSGVAVWWPRTRKVLKSSLCLTWRKGSHRLWRSLHVAGGMYALLLLLVMALTGLTWSFGWYRTGFYWLLGAEVQTSRTQAHRGGQAEASGRDKKGAPATAHWQEAYEQLRSGHPDVDITVSADGTASLPRNPFANVRGLVYSLHTGTWGGWPTRILYFFAALIGTALPLTGYYLWIRRLVSRSRRKPSGERP